MSGIVKIKISETTDKLSRVTQINKGSKSKRKSPGVVLAQKRAGKDRKGDRSFSSYFPRSCLDVLL